MTSTLHRRVTSILAVGAIAVLVAFIVVLWVYVGHHTTPLPPAPATNNNNSDSESATIASHVLGYEEDVDTRLVRLVKVAPPPLQGHDVIFDQQLHAQHSGGGEAHHHNHHHSGHFRHLGAELWDPHPEYEIEAFGARLHLVLRHDAAFVRAHGRPDGRVEVTHVFRNRTLRVRPDARVIECFYTGKVRGQPLDSDVAVSLCGGMTGYIRAKEGKFYIEPVEPYTDVSSQASLLHMIHRVNEDPPAPRRSPDPIENTEMCETDTEGSKIVFDDLLDESYDENYTHHRNKRDTWTKHYPADGEATRGGSPGAAYHAKNREYFIETLVVTDKKMAEYHKTDEQLIHYIYVLMHHVAMLYKDATIGNPISLAVVRIMILKEEEFARPERSNKYDYVYGVNSAEMLRQFCRFQYGVNMERGEPEHHDTALLLTRETLCRNTETGQCKTLGLAELGTMCAEKSSCAIIKDKGLPTSYTIAHELGHVLSMPHDDDEDKCARFNNGTSATKYIMARVIQNNTKPWTWSICSRTYLTEFLDSKRSKCLYNEPEINLITNESSRLPGETFDADRQCELMFGVGQKLCSYMPKCVALYCEMEPGDVDYGCVTHHQPWADGTVCGRGRWCVQGHCVARDWGILQPVAGGWGSWRKWGECSRTCGGGIRKAGRECDSPRPSNGGPYCIGPSVRYGSCNTELCEEDAMDFREKQCAEFNGNTRGIPGLTTNVKWVPKYGGIEAEEMCKLYCRVQHTNQHYLLVERVVDGTKCGLNSFDVCVNGACRRGGCDNRLDSNLTLDACGVCGGDNSLCEEVSGTYNAQPTYGYSKVVRVPRGSSNLDIRQHGFGGSNEDGNYLALVDSETGHYALNGDNHVSTFIKVFMYGGVTLEYTGTKSVTERINSSGSVRLKKDLILELLSVDRLLLPNITYSYMIVRGKSPTHTWQLYEGEWSPCSRICGGVRRAVPRCVEIATGRVVEESHCEHLDRDVVLGAAARQECNVHCRLAWKVRDRQACSAHCGRGERTLMHQCVMIENGPYLQHLDANENDVPWATMVDDNHCSDIERPEDVEPCEGPCDATRWHYEDWSECSKSCGSGIQSRSSYCVDSIEQRLADSACAGKVRAHQQPCNTQRCPTWAVGEWTPCSATCGRGYRTKPYHCQTDGHVLLPEACDSATRPVVREPCDAERRACARWEAAAWPPCPLPCAALEAVQRRRVQCRALGDGAELADVHCADMLRPNETRLCPRSSECTPLPAVEENLVLVEPPSTAATLGTFTWRSGPWSECSRSCGGGTKSRNVACQNKSGLQRDDRCDPKLRPIASVQCETHTCPTWNHGDWGSCNADCHRYRLVMCQSRSGVHLADDHCSVGERPANATPCAEHPKCRSTSSATHRYKWKIGVWSPCSKSCGEGVKTRHVSCTDVVHNVTLVEHFCRGTRRPKVQRRCVHRPCEYTWLEGPWTTCTHSCGEGLMYRNVTCHKVLAHGHSVHSKPEPSGKNLCNAHTRPPSHKTCILEYCNSQYSWVTGPWNECTRSCGMKGRQTRHLYCHHFGKKVQKKLCPRALKPPRKQKCNQRHCSVLRSCLEVKFNLRTNKDGEYELSVPITPNSNPNSKRTVLRVYCHGMHSQEPREYLSLANEGRDNYAEMYDQSLQNVNSCPNHGQRLEKCDCIPADFPLAGLTLFYKVRLNVTSMQIIGNDYTFSRQNKGARVPYGTAGDCYSRLKDCPQGRFSINLNGTGVHLEGRVSWVASESTASLSVHRASATVISGKCGGYCGRCAPDPHLGLLVQPDIT